MKRVPLDNPFIIMSIEQYIFGTEKSQKSHRKESNTLLHPYLGEGRGRGGIWVWTLYRHNYEIPGHVLFY